jgi:2-hydroxychromene-2-carboxylate isomerase
MREITFYLDFVSPYAWLAFAQLPAQLEGISCHVRYRPVLLGALLKQHANPGPAGIPPKRAWTYRHAEWLGHAQGTTLQMPQRHPFNPLPLLRLALECSEDGCINRFTADALFRHVWEGGGDALGRSASPPCVSIWRRSCAPMRRPQSAPRACCAPIPRRPQPRACSAFPQ